LAITDGRSTNLIDQGIDRFGFGSISLGRDKEGNLLLWDQGLVATKHNDGTYRAIPNSPLYSRPIMVGAKAEFNLVHGPNGIVDIHQKGGSDLTNYNREVQRWIRRGWVLQSGALSTNRDKMMLLFKSGAATDRGLVILDRRVSRTLRYKCVPKNKQSIAGLDTQESSNGHSVLIPSEVKHVPTPQRPVTFREIGPSEHKLAAWTFKPKTKPRGRIVYFRGGPNSNLLQDNIEQVDARILEAGYEIIKYEYSGARQVSVNIYNRLREKLQDSLAADAALIERDLRMRGVAKRTIVLASSFGAMMAGAVSKNSEIKIDHFVLPIPYSEWIPAVVYAPTLDPLWSVRQSEMQDATFGVPSILQPSRFNEIGKEFRRVICVNRKVTIIFGMLDRSIEQAGWRDDCKASSSEIIELNAGHLLSNDMMDAISAVVTSPP
jgi:hypothetical protein